MKPLLQLVTFCLPLLMNGCYTPLIEGAQQGYDASQRGALKTEAASNIPVDEYNLGNNYCCRGGGPMDGLTIYDNNKATHWYCKAARHGYGPAQLQLARLYSGHAIRGLHVALRASALMDDAETNLSVALMWASIAAKNTGKGDIDDATELRNKITQKATSKQRARAISLIKNWRTAPCEWAEVISRNNNKEK